MKLYSTAGLWAVRRGTDHDMPHDPRALLAIYLNDHLAGATAGVRLARRLAKGTRETELGSEVSTLARDISHDRAELQRLMQRLGVVVRRYKLLGVAAGEMAGRLKLNGRWVGRSPLSTLVELEVMRLGIEGKASGWRTLRGVADNDHRLSKQHLDDLSARAENQAERVEELRKRAAYAIFSGRAEL